jgi:hypothetical protein
LETIDLGDERLNKRSRATLETLARDPGCSVNAACQGWAETQGAYRLFDNERTTPEKILAPHAEATRRRIADHQTVLLVQDSTELDYSAHPPEGAGPLHHEEQLGFLDHSHVAFTPEGLCLGVLEADWIARSPEGFGQSKQRQYDPLETKETFRWLEGYRLACAVQQQTPRTQIISIADCEGDLYEVYVEAARHQRPADFVIRAGKDRRVPELDSEALGKTYRKVRQEIERAEVKVIRDIHLPRTPKREARDARLEMRAETIRVMQPHPKYDLPQVELNVVLVSEVDPPDDGTAVEWLLLTSLPIETPEEVLLVADYYVGRWPIEIYFRVLKTGCQVEEIQLENTARLFPCLMFYKIIAWRVMYLTYLGRECPELPCDAVFADHEWKPVWRVVKEEPCPASPPPLKEFLLLLAQLGGHNNRRHDLPPGPQSLWTGLRRMHDFSTAWLTFGPGGDRVMCN